MSRTGFVWLLVTLVLASALVAPAATTTATATTTGDSPTEPTMYVDLEANGDATLSLVTVYDVTDEDERETFDSLADDEDTQEELLERFVDRLEPIANETDGTVSADSVDVHTEDDAGIVTLTVSWSSMAVVENDRVVLTEPFASGFDLEDRSLVVTGPDDATLESATPAPATDDGSEATWDAGTDLSGFDVTFTLTDSAETDDDAADDGEADAAAESDDEDADGTPGFGVVLTVTALIVGLSIVGVRTRL